MIQTAISNSTAIVGLIWCWSYNVMRWTMQKWINQSINIINSVNSWYLNRDEIIMRSIGQYTELDYKDNRCSGWVQNILQWYETNLVVDHIGWGKLDLKDSKPVQLRCFTNKVLFCITKLRGHWGYMSSSSVIYTICMVLHEHSFFKLSIQL